MTTKEEEERIWRKGEAREDSWGQETVVGYVAGGGFGSEEVGSRRYGLLRWRDAGGRGRVEGDGEDWGEGCICGAEGEEVVDEDVRRLEVREAEMVAAFALISRRESRRQEWYLEYVEERRRREER